MSSDEEELVKTIKSLTKKLKEAGVLFDILKKLDEEIDEEQKSRIEKEVKFVECGDCKGLGEIYGPYADSITCRICHGQGTVTYHEAVDYGFLK